MSTAAETENREQIFTERYEVVWVACAEDSGEYERDGGEFGFLPFQDGSYP